MRQLSPPGTPLPQVMTGGVAAASSPLARAIDASATDNAPTQKMNVTCRIAFRFYRGCPGLGCADRPSYLWLQREQPHRERESGVILRAGWILSAYDSIRRSI